MTTRRAEPVARRDRLTTRRAPTQRSAARTAEAVFIPPGRTAPRTRHHQAFIPRPGPHSTWQAPTTIAAVRPAHAGPGTDSSRPPAALWAHRTNAYRCRKPDSSSRPANPPEWAFGAGPLPSTPGPVATSDSALGAPGSVERRPPELTERSGRPSRHEPRAVRQVNRALLGISGSQGSRQWRPPFGADGAVSGPRVPRPMTDRAKENARGAAVMVGQAAAESAVRSDTESALLAPRATVLTPC